MPISVGSIHFQQECYEHVTQSVLSMAFFSKLDRIEIGTTEELEQAHQDWLHSPVPVFNAEVLSAITRADATK